VNSELIIDVTHEDISIALLEDKQLVELNREKRNIKFAVGDFHLGKVKKIMPGLNAAFVDVGYEKDAFLHYLDLGPQFSSLKKFMSQITSKKPVSLQKFKADPDIDKNGLITQVLQSGQDVLVQIAKEPISTKGPRLTSELSIAGRYLVLLPFSNKVSVSQKIKLPEEKLRLKKLVQSLRPHNFGVIVRTVAEDAKNEEIEADLKSLVRRWEESTAKLRNARAPKLIYEEIGRASAILRDILNPTFSSIYINDESVYEEVRDFVSVISPDKEKIVKLYKGQAPIFDQFGVTKQIKASFGRTVSFKSGAYLIVEKTEAMHVIDVNSGNRSKSNQNQESNALDVNLAAVEEIARQLRLRDIGGIIVIDLIDMTDNEHRALVYDRMKEAMALDRAKHQILQLSKFCIMQITRQRVRPEMNIVTDENCPSCYGKGNIKPSILFVDTLESKIDYLVNSLGEKDFTLRIHPFIYSHITKGWFKSIEKQWRKKYSRNMTLIPMQEFPLLHYVFSDRKGDEINLTEEFDKL